MEGRFISYIRVSTLKQGRSGLGEEAQRATIQETATRNGWTVLQEFKEIESGKIDDRPQLRKALEACKRTGARLLVAKLDRLSRDVAFVAGLMKTKAEFVACDMPEANTFSIHIMSAMAQYERELISKRTKDALQAAKARGKKLGKNNLTQEGASKGAAESRKIRQAKADEYAARMKPIIEELQNQGLNLNQIARRMMENGELTPRGGAIWTPTTVKNVLAR